MYILGNALKNELVRKEEKNKYYDENIVIDIEDTNNTHSIIAKYIKPESTVLDVGCGAGYIGALLKSKNCKLYGIDRDEKALEIAKNKVGYHKVYHFSVTDMKSEKYKSFFKEKIKYDYILFADVLEHVENPGDILLNFSKKLTTTGSILTSVPNVAHFDIIRGLLNRTFNYNKIGILDNTHLRFFTKDSFQDMIMSLNDLYKTNFSIQRIGKTIDKPNYISEYASLEKILNQDNELYVLQYVYAIKQGGKTEVERNEKDYCQILNQILKEYERLVIENKNKKTCWEKIFKINRKK